MHIAIIPDGNRRWARKRGLPDWMGHAHGVRTMEKILRKALDMGIKYLTFYTFSMENLKKRPKLEKRHLFNLLEKKIRELADDEEIHKRKVRVRFLGRIYCLPKKLREAIKYAEEKTKKYKKFSLNFCIAYDGRDEIVDAIREILRKGIKKVDRRVVKKHLYTRDIPPPDLIIRTGMKREKRLSAYLLWDSAYSEFYFTSTYWPAFTPRMFEKAVEDLKRRERRYGR
ncbi:MAG: di-trans,poly-cis-decaprenylcistransferase [Nanoarchaeota archaeon]|nr:di-trans,poly-cis-decaprenylcistransferase [Nanoarchaeota archaeon]